jgi:hypothetical protein
MPTLTLPQLVAGRDLAAAAVRRLGPITDAEVVVDARPLVSGTASFAGQLVRSTVVEGHAAQLAVVGGPAEFLADARAAATELGVADRVVFAADDADLPVPS